MGCSFYATRSTTRRAKKGAGLRARGLCDPQFHLDGRCLTARSRTRVATGKLAAHTTSVSAAGVRRFLRPPAAWNYGQRIVADVENEAAERGHHTVDVECVLAARERWQHQVETVGGGQVRYTSPHVGVEVT